MFGAIGLGKFWQGLLFITCMAASMLVAAGSAQAILIGSMDRSATNVKLCLDSDCPLVDNHPFHPGRRIVVYETKGKWARVSRYIDRDQAGVNYPGFFLPEKVAMWMPVTELPATLAEQVLGMPADEYQKLEEAKAKRRKFSFVPRRPGLPKTDPRGPENIFEVAAASQKPGQSGETANGDPSKSAVVPHKNPDSDIPLADAEEVAVVESDKADSERNAKIEKLKQEIARANAAAKTEGSDESGIEEAEIVEVVEVEDVPDKRDSGLEPIEPQTIATSAVSKIPKMSPKTSARLASVQADEVATATPAAAPEPKIPSTLTRRLKDKRLRALPSKPGGNLDLKSVIALRFHALAMLENGECSSIETGGPSLALKGWVYIKCGGDPFLHQYEVE